MIFYVVAFPVLLHVLLWGAGLAMLAMPRPWRRFWPVFVAPAGLALQSAVVWGGAYANFAGTRSYAWWSEIVPLALLVLAARRRNFRQAVADLSRCGLVWLATAGSLALLILPLAIAAKGLTTVSLGSCDAADYAAGARVLMEFAHGDRTGFLGLHEVVQVMSVDNFYDFWLRLNHFTPSALVALNGSILHCAPHELTGVMTMVILASTLPVVFWVARAVFGYSGGASLVIAVLYGISPIPWYAAAHVAPGQLLAAQAIALLNWAGIALWNGRLTWRRGLQFGGVLLIGYWLVLGSYNFILLVALVPGVAYVGLRIVERGGWSRVPRWVLMMTAPLAVAVVLFWARAAGLVERFMLFQTYDFGWRIPVLTPEGWLGMLGGADLHGWSWMIVRSALAAVVVGAFGWALFRSVRQGRSRVWVVASVLVPILGAYGYLEFRGARLGTNASYDAYKLFAVFYPLLLPALCWWITLRWSRRIVDWFVVAMLSVVVLGFNLFACGTFIVALARPPLIVDGALRQLRKIEAMADVKSVNLMIPDMWSRLWANAFLLRKAQYFSTHTYEGRLNTPLRGEWDLQGGTVTVKPRGDATREIAGRFVLADTRAPGFVRATAGSGWFAVEQAPTSEDRWQWIQRDATIQIDNPSGQPITMNVIFDGRGMGERDIAIVSTDGSSSTYVHLDEQRRKIALPAVTIPPGHSTLALHSKQPATRPPGDQRALAVCVFSLTLEPQR
jgi:hypothetical protein